MIRQVELIDNQNIYDVAMAVYGSVDGLRHIRALNYPRIKNFHTFLPAGTAIKVDYSLVMDKQVVQHYANRKLTISSGYLEQPDFNEDFNEDFRS
jgi:hypothetical protein